MTGGGTGLKAVERGGWSLSQPVRRARLSVSSSRVRCHRCMAVDVAKSDTTSRLLENHRDFMQQGPTVSAKCRSLADIGEVKKLLYGQYAYSPHPTAKRYA